MDACLLPATPLVPGLSALSFLVRKGDDPTLPPDHLEARYRGPSRWFDRFRNRLAQRNFATAVQALQAEWGLGAETSHLNTLAREWRFGMAQVGVMVFPPELQTHVGLNTRDHRDPDGVSECRLLIHPGWLPPLTATEIDMARSFRVIGQVQDAGRWMQLAPERRKRWLRAEGPVPRSGYGIATGARGLVLVAGSTLVVLGRADLIRISRDVTKPAKGPGGVELGIVHAPKAFPDARPHHLILASVPYAPSALATEAAELAAGLDLPLTQSACEDW
ncbi:MAG: hypothetical protein CFE34_15330 [Rhodobacteraceae bacterium PARR1]|nr:MAG: hypothetical protein CFE34_15330 [Rhodobacteraceae bacterium PARR1]